MIVGMADTAASVLCHWEATTVTSTTESGVKVRKSESGTVRLVRTACKALSKHGSEQCGVYKSFTTFLLSHGVSRNLQEIDSIFFFMMLAPYSILQN